MSDTGSRSGSEQPENRATRSMPFDQSSSEDEAPQAPRGRLAARMAGRSTIVEDEPSAEEEEDPEEIYRKMRQQMLGTGPSNDASKTPEVSRKVTTKATATRKPSASPAGARRSSPAKSTSSSRSPNSPADAHSARISPQPAPISMPFLQNDDSDAQSGSDSDDLPSNPANNRRLQQLIAKRREERLQKEAQEQEQRTLQAEASAAALFEEEEDEDEDTQDATADQILSSSARPTRKASKKAIEEMNKETQRMNRNMQLTHQAKVKKRFTMTDFAARFARKKEPETSATRPQEHQPATSSSAPASSDNERDNGADTPPSSPPSADEQHRKSPRRTNVPNNQANEEEELPSLENVLSSQPTAKVDKGKAPATTEAPITVNRASLPANQRPLRIRVLPGARPSQLINLDDSDDDLEIVKDRFSAFNNIQPQKANESRAFLTLRTLAGIGSEPQKKGKNTRPSMTPGELEMVLRKRAALQLRQERDERIAALRAQGKIIMTEEEREKDQMELENMLERARQEADELRKKEKKAAKAEGGDDSMLASDDESEDEDYVVSGEEDAGDEAEVELSGSEDEDEMEVDADANPLLDDSAEEDADAETESEDDQAAETVAPTQSEEARSAPKPTIRKRRVIEDDDDEEDNQPQPTAPQQEGQLMNDDLAAAFGFGPKPAAAMGLSQMFAATMGSPTQSQSQSQAAESQEQDSMELFRKSVPFAALPSLEQAFADETQESVVEDSQNTVNRAREESTPSQQINLDYTQGALTTPAVARLSQMSNVPSPSQDVGFGYRNTPARRGSIRPSTADTVVLPVAESPLPQRRRGLQQRVAIAEESDADDDEPVGNAVPNDQPAKHNTAFDVMKKAASKPKQPDFDRKKSEAKAMFDEQAEESEDEYAGLGGDDRENSDEEADAEDKAMIDESEVNVDERKLAAFYAEKARADNEAQTSKLYKDLMSGALRRQRGGAFDLDSDEDEQINERRRRKQREEARKRRLLLDDEKLGKFDGNQKKEAFLRAIEDREELEEIDLLDGKEDGAEEAVPDSQDPASQQATQTGEAQLLTSISGNALKRKPEDQFQGVDRPAKRLPGPLRRTLHSAFRKPASLDEVRESLSFLIDEPHAREERVSLSDDEYDGLDDQDIEDVAELGSPDVSVERAPYSARRTPAKPEVVDRLLLRNSTSGASESAESSNMAFQSESMRSFGSFKAPSLLRRATTNQSTSASTSMPPPPLNRDGSSSIRMGGSKKSSINYAAREAERRVIVEKAERARLDNVKKIAGMRRSGGLGSFGGGFGGGFE